MNFCGQVFFKTKYSGIFFCSVTFGTGIIKQAFLGAEHR